MSNGGIDGDFWNLGNHSCREQKHDNAGFDSVNKLPNLIELNWLVISKYQNFAQTVKTKYFFLTFFDKFHIIQNYKIKKMPKGQPFEKKGRKASGLSPFEMDKVAGLPGELKGWPVFRFRKRVF